MRFLTLCGVVGFGGGFLMISEPLRESLGDILTKGQILMTTNQPYSYVGVAAGVIVALGCYMYRCSLPR